MENDDMRAELDELRARLAAQERAFAAFCAQSEGQPTTRLPRRLPRRIMPLVLAALLVMLVPLATLAANPFTDLQPGSVHNANIDAIYNAGITTGCVPNAQYCPTDNVTRQEMASFLARTAGLGTNPPVANAKTLQGYAPSGLTRVGQGLGTNTIGTDFMITAVTPAYDELPGASVTIEAPGSGFVLVSSSVSVTSFANITVLARVSDVTPGVTTSTPSASRSDAGDFGTGMLNISYVFPVTGKDLPAGGVAHLRRSGGAQWHHHGALRPLRPQRRRAVARIEQGAQYLAHASGD